MKVFSKNHKNNKSTPLLPLHLPNSLKPTAKPKGISKVTSYKNKLTKANHHISNIALSTQIPSKKQMNAFTQRINTSLYIQGDDTINHSYRMSPVPLISSVNYASCRSHKQRYSQESSEPIDSVLCYSKMLQNRLPATAATTDKQNKSRMLNLTSKQSDNGHKNNSASKSITKFELKTDNHRDVQYAIKKIYAEQNNKENKENVMEANRGDNTRKMVSQYKNSKIMSIKPTQKIEKKLSLASFKVGKKLGRGRFGSVHIAQQKVTGMLFALKMIDLVQVKEEQMEDQLVEEIKLQLFMNHPNVLKMYGCFKDKNTLCMILEYADEKCLFAKMQNKFQQKIVGYYTKQMIEALKYCHSESILHRDLKPQNILLCQGVAKLGDFGWAAYAPKYKRSTFCGTLDYVPPQILKGKTYDQRVDIWSLGVLIYQMATGRAPFETQSINPDHVEAKTMNRIIDGDLIVPLTLPVDLRKLIFTILSTDPTERPSLEQIQHNTWLRNFSEEQLQIQRPVWEFWIGKA